MDDDSDGKRITAVDIAGLRSDTSRLADSFDRLTDRVAANETDISGKADKSQVEKNRRLTKRANINSFIAIIAVLISLFTNVNSSRTNNARIDQIFAVRGQSRAATCAVFQAYTDALALSGGVPKTQAQHDLIQARVNAFVAKVNEKLTVIDCTLVPTHIPDASPGG